MSRKIIILSLLVIFASIGAYYSVVWRSGYMISEITVTGNHSISREEILAVGRVKDSLMIEKDAEIELIQDRLMNHPEIKKAFVSKTPPSELKIEVVEKRPVAILNTGSELMLIDEELETFPFRQSAKTYDIPVISGVRIENTLNPKSRFNKEDLHYALFLILSAFNDSKILYSNISEINLSDTGKSIVYLSEDSSPFYLPRDIKKSITDEEYRNVLLGKLKIFEGYLKQSLDNHLKSDVKYVDLRYSNHVIVNSNH
ncbi:MAG: FtsQ-type POTRA domain-containing protein [Ignavibacteria bacterium]|nr:FtsQ-type POTRA domain-containing protein [Ignavibacteria bacterium]